MDGFTGVTFAIRETIFWPQDEFIFCQGGEKSSKVCWGLGIEATVIARGGMGPDQ